MALQSEISEWLSAEKVQKPVLAALSTPLKSWRADDLLQRSMDLAKEHEDTFAKKKGKAASKRELNLMNVD